MTGNIVFVGFALAGAGSISLSASLVALASFLLGAFAGGWLGAHHGEHRARLLRAAGSAQAAMIVIALLISISAAEPIHGATRFALVAALALAMGLQNAAAQRLAIPELTTTVLTRTLTGLASEAKVLGGAGSQAGRRGSLSPRCCSVPCAAGFSCLTCPSPARSRSQPRWPAPSPSPCICSPAPQTMGEEQAGIAAAAADTPLSRLGIELPMD